MTNKNNLTIEMTCRAASIKKVNWAPILLASDPAKQAYRMASQAGRAQLRGLFGWTHSQAAEIGALPEVKSGIEFDAADLAKTCLEVGAITSEQLAAIEESIQLRGADFAGAVAILRGARIAKPTEADAETESKRITRIAGVAGALLARVEAHQAKIKAEADAKKTDA